MNGHLFLGPPLLNEEVNDAKVLQGLPVADVLQLCILNTQVEHGGMGF